MSNVKTSKQILKRSVDFISKNMLIMSNELPPEFLEYWIDDEPIMRIENGGADQYTIFIYAWVMYNRLNNHLEFTANEEMIQDLYLGWQTKLSLVQLSMHELVSIKPFKLFEFSDIKGINIEFEEIITVR